MRGTDYFIRKRVWALAVAAARRPHSSCSLEEAGRVLLLYRADDAAQVEPCLEQLRRRGKRVLAYAYVAGKEVNVWQFPTAAALERFRSLEADILIDLTPPGCYPAHYLMLQHPCRFKVGAKQEGVDLYDLSISVTEREDIGRLFGHILFYLQAIRSK